MAARTLTFVSSNEEKFHEIRDAVAASGVTLVRLSLDLPEIQSIDPAEVAGYKAQRAYEILGTAVLVEDTGLALTAWNGYPGALIKWVLKAVSEEGLCRQLDAWSDRSATATVVLCLHDGQTQHCFTGTTDGAITLHPRGTFGFGWDSIFQPAGSDLTYGEMPREAKMQISMRARAVAGLSSHLLTSTSRA
ncbi:MAG TPA: non-canonical purine NTP pyrophosphatase [Aggregatilinea sp.]|uniref:non-canonical purine NTP pyrophosphatase n=1 Tax=Aggregatilinea sp. TaxID=2806333 RepID=UPI002B64CCD5|nr:non-canonical purine NTP pyrophosphatase [Aggregatilinea sp.]HML21228.1 non-canonical purine NTP pyrophosphatase [Aggregatilinea sp.]